MSKQHAVERPKGIAVIRAVPQPSDLNVNGNVFGGWILSQMDIAGGVIASRRSRGSVATVAVEKMTFHCPIEVGDSISIYGEIERVGTTSITIKLDVMAERGHDVKMFRVTEGRYIFVAVDSDGNPRPVDPRADFIKA